MLLIFRCLHGVPMEQPCAKCVEKDAKPTIPGGAPDQETADLMNRLSDLQGWCALMARKDSGGIEAARLVQDARAFIVERLYPRAIAARLTDVTPTIAPN